ncbi:MAG TPA: RHS repeat-associated core domain-containing protein [Verrucomicrobiae bacterium]|nr:RHS repeat-associated core domain-containing protein [Verrucomicrobiae bacterium]
MVLDAGYINLNSQTIAPTLATPNALQIPFNRPNVNTVYNSGVLQQVECPQGLVNIVVISGYEYHLDCYYSTQFTPPLGGIGPYQINSGATPFVTWDVQNPDGASAFNRLFITEIRGSNQRQFQYTFNSSTWQWNLTLPDGQTSHSTSLTRGTDSTLTNYLRQVWSGSELVKQTQKLYKYVPSLNYLLLEQQIDGTGSLTNITTYTYYSSDPSNGAHTNLLQRVDYPDGNWVYYVYDQYGRKSTEYSAYLNNPAPTLGTVPNPVQNGCKETDYYYTLDATADGQGDNGTINPDTVRKTVISVPVGNQLVEISRTYHLVAGYDQEETMVCPNPGALWTDAANLHTITYSYYSDPADFETGLPEIAFRPDGTATRYTYASDRSYTIEQTGQPSAWGDLYASIIGGTQTETDVDSTGRITARTVTDIATAVILSSDTYAYTDANQNPLDPLGRTYNKTDLAGRTTQYIYECCALDHVIDPDDVTTYYLYDNNTKRLLGTSVNVNGSSSAIQTTNILDSLGRVTATLRVATDGSITTLSKSQYDILGRQIQQTNALGGVTTLTNFTDFTSGHTFTTNTFPDGGTRVEILNRDGQLSSVSGTAAFPTTYTNYAEQDPVTGFWRAYTWETKLDINGGTNEWTKTYVDGAGQNFLTAYAPRPGVDTTPPLQQTLYNEFGQVWKQIDPDGVTTLFCYNAKAQLEYQVLAVMNTTLAYSSYDTFSNALGSGTLQTGNDRITQIEHSVAAASGTIPDLTQDSTYLFDGGQTTGTLVSTVQTATTGLTNWSTVYRDANTPVIRRTVIVPGTTRMQTTYAPDGTAGIQQYQYGRLVSSVMSNQPLGVITSTTYGYDPQGRKNSVTDGRNGTTTYTLNNADQTSSVTTPPAGLAQPPQTTTTTFDVSLRAVQITQPDGGIVANAYAATGLLTNQSGSRVYPVAYTYDAQGRQKTMTTWTSYGTHGGAATTTWNYNAYRGFLDNKRYADSTGPDYTYTAAGRLLTRLWARSNSQSQRLLTTYTYGFNSGVQNDGYGDLVGVAYSNDPQNTPALAYGYDRRGRQTTNSVGSAEVILAYDNANNLLSETNVSGTLAGLSVTNGYDQYLRRTQLAVLNGPSPLVQEAYAYDSASRLQTATDNTSATPYSAAYSYLANSPLVSQITFANNGSTRMTSTKQYDYLNRLTQISSAPSAASPATFNYEYNSANQRTRRIDADGSYWRYGYDSLGQVISGHKFFSDQTPVPGQSFDYTFDTIGNRTQTLAGGDQNGANQRIANYHANTLNQYTNRDVPGGVDIMGIAYATNAVTVNGQSPFRKGEYFRDQLSVNNASSPVWQSISVAANWQTSISGNLFVPQTPEPFGYDLDGNLTSDGRWYYGWDAENRLIAMTNKTSVGPQQVLLFTYDAKGRRIHKQVIGASANDLRFVYDGWNLLGEINTANSPVRTYMWGLDLSGSLQGAGGVGGMLEIAYYGSSTTNCFAAFDGNGNVAVLANAADGTSVAQYEYDPSGQVIRATGPMAKANPFRFSTKYQDDECDLLYYGFRYYNASTGRWMSRDPLGDLAFQQPAGLGDLASQESLVNDYLFVRNNTPSSHDFLGLCDVVTSGSGTVNGGLWTVIKHHPGIYTHYPPVTDTFTLTCPSSKPYLAIWGLLSSPYTPWYGFPATFGTFSVAASPPTYTISIQVPSRVTIFDRQYQLSGLYIRGCCTCHSPGVPARSDPPPEAPPYPDPATPAPIWN